MLVLNPLRDTLTRAGIEARDRSSPFQAEAESALSASGPCGRTWSVRSAEET